MNFPTSEKRTASNIFSEKLVAERARRVLPVWLFAIALLALISFVQNLDFLFFLSTIAVLGGSAVAGKLERDPATLFVLIHPSVTYVGTTIVYGSLHSNAELNLLFDRGLAFSVVAVYQVGILAAYFMFRILKGKTISSHSARMSAANPPIFIAALTGFILLSFQFSTALSLLESFIPVITAIFVYCIGAIVISPKARAALWALGLSFAFLGTAGLAGNSRTPIFILLLVWAVYLIGSRPKLLTFKGIFYALVAVTLLNLITSSFIDVRSMRRDIGPLDLIAQTLSRVSNPENIIEALPFASKDKVFIDVSLGVSRYYSPFLRGETNDISADTSLFGRLALIAHMDIVTGRYGFVTSLDWTSIYNSVLSTLPSIGQIKQTNWADRIVWELGLRDRSSVGFPLITPAGEFYLMGGHAGLLLLTAIFFIPIYFGLHWLKLLLGSGFPYLAVAISVIYGFTMTGTAIAVVSAGIRTLPLVLISLWVIRRLGPKVSAQSTGSHSKGRLSGGAYSNAKHMEDGASHHSKTSAFIAETVPPQSS